MMRHLTDLILRVSTGLILVAGCDPTGAGNGTAQGKDGGNNDVGVGDVGMRDGDVRDAGSKDGDGPPSIPDDRSPVITVIDNTTGKPYQTCAGRIAETSFGNALCTCANTRVSGYLKTRSFDSKAGASTDVGGTVGINQTYVTSAGFTDVGGSLAIAGSTSLSFAGYLKVGTDFRAAGDATVAAYTNIGRNAWLGGNYTALGPVAVGGDLHTGGNVMALPLKVGGNRSQENVVIAPPCPCEAEDLLNIGSIIDDGKLHNDNTASGITPTKFNAAVGNVYATLPSGKFFVENISGMGSLNLAVTGKAALFVDDSVAVTGNLEITLGPTAEIDIFVRNNVALTGRAVLGTKDRPAATRLYVGGDGEVLLLDGDHFAGNVYAPRALVTAIGFADVYGSVFARDFVSPGFANFHYDRAIQKAGDSCAAPPPPACNKCGSCTGGKACVNGVCGPCLKDSDCCGQMMCAVGKCMWALIRPEPM